MAKSTPEPARVLTKGAVALAKWRGKRRQVDVHDLLGVDAVSYNRYERGIRRPSGSLIFQIEKLTNGAVPAKAWHEPPRARVKRSA